MTNWKRVWLEALVLGLFAALIAGGLAFVAMQASAMTSEPREEEPKAYNCYRDGQMTEVPPNLEVVRCQPHFPRNSDGKAHVFCHLVERT